MASRAAPLVLETERLTLRAFHADDESALGVLWKRNADRFRDNFHAAVAQIVERNDGASYLEARVADWRAHAGYWYALRERSRDALVGQIHVKHLDWELGRAELAYLIDYECEGKGLTTEAARRVAAMCFDDLGLHKVFLRTITTNTRSANVAARCGFHLEGTLRGEFLAAGHTRVDVHYFGLLATDRRPP
jgi:ribosomal-protein-alanine N-acetyltransferase